MKLILRVTGWFLMVYQGSRIWIRHQQDVSIHEEDILHTEFGVKSIVSYTLIYDQMRHAQEAFRNYLDTVQGYRRCMHL